MGEAGAAPEKGDAKGLWSNTFSKSPGNLERKMTKDEDDGSSRPSECEPQRMSVCLLTGLHMNIFFLLGDSAFLIFSLFLRNLLVSNLAFLWSISNRTTPSCHTVVGPAL